MVYEQKKDYFSFSEQALYRIRATLYNFRFPIRRARTIAKPPKDTQTGCPLSFVYGYK